MITSLTTINDTKLKIKGIIQFTIKGKYILLLSPYYFVGKVKGENYELCESEVRLTTT